MNETFRHNEMTEAFEKKKRDSIYITIIIGLSFVVLYGIFYFIKGDYFLGIRNLITGLLLWLTFIYCIFKPKRIKLFASLLLFMALIFYSHIFYTGGFGNHSYMWLYTFPIIAFFLAGNKKGVIWVTVSLLSLGTIVTLSKIKLIALPYNSSFFIIFFASYIVISFLIYFLNRVIENADEKIKHDYLEMQKLLKQLEITLESEKAAKEEINQTKKDLEKTNIALKEAAEKANEASRLKSEFLAMMSHELKTPLSGIIGYTQLLKMNVNLDKDANEFVDCIFNSSQRLNELLSNLLELSVSHAGKEINIEYTSFDVEKMIKDIKVIFDTRLKSRNNKFRFNIFCEKTIYSSPIRIQQILLNLVGNAAKFTENGEIELTLNKENDTYLFSIRDTGIGIDKSKYQEIFDIFKQIDGTLSSKHGGVGIGLSISKKFVEALGGKIWVESELGKGSTFYFTIEYIKITTGTE